MAENRGGADRRILRVEREIREVVSTFLLRGVQGVEGFVSVSRVHVSGDFRSAKIYVAVMDELAKQEQSVAALNKYAFAVQSEINKRLQMKFCPKVKFYRDEALENQMRVENILQELRTKREQEQKLNAQATAQSNTDHVDSKENVNEEDSDDL